jgi:hypothetical protein
MADQRLVRYQPNPAEVARSDVAWLDDDDAALVESKDVASAVGLSLISGGGGHFYTGDHITGLGLTLAAVGAVVAGPMLLPLSVAFLPLLAVLGGGAVTAAQKAKKINRYVLRRRQHESETAPHPQAYKLLHAMAKVDARAAHQVAQFAGTGGAAALMPQQPAPPPAAPPSLHSELIDKLRKLAHLRDANVISDVEHRERKIDLLAAVATGASRDQIDDLLFDVLPLIQEGTLVNEDVEFVKSLGS